MKSTKATSVRSSDGVVLELNWRYFSSYIEGLHTTASIRKNSRTDLNMIDETQVSISRGGG